MSLDYSKYKLLMVDDDVSYLNMAKMSLEDKGLNVQIIGNPVEALEQAKTNKFDLILLDYFMPEMIGDEFVSKLRETDKDTLIVLQTGYADEATPIELLEKLDIQGYFDKTKGIDDLVLTIATVLKTRASSGQ